MANPYISELRIFSFNYPPKGWAFCNGQLLAINQNQALFSLLGTTYGGNGQTNFALPNLQGRIPMHPGNGFTLGQSGGESAHTLITTELPAHSHQVQASGNAPNKTSPTGNYFASNTGFTPYGATPNELMSLNACTAAGGSQPHNNLSPFLTLNIGICLTGIFPSQS